MTHVVWKFRLYAAAGFDITMPRRSELLHVALEDDEPMLWALCNPEETQVTRKIIVAGTGHHLTGDVVPRYVGTLTLNGLVWHVFDAGEAQQ